MTESNPSSLVENGHLLLDLFGYWPSFHDAEIDAVCFSVEDRRVSVRVELRTWEISEELDERGYFKLVKKTRVTLRFHDCLELDLDPFEPQNVIYGLKIREAVRNPGLREVEMEGIYGFCGFVLCRRVEIAEAMPLE